MSVIGPTLTVDASVWVSAYRTEAHSSQCRAFLQRAEARTVRLVLPTLLRVELAGALARAGARFAAVEHFVARLTQIPNIQFVALDLTLSAGAATLAARRLVRGADAVYGAVAQLHRATLITLDREQAERLRPAVPTCAPADWPEA